MFERIFGRRPVGAPVADRPDQEGRPRRRAFPDGVTCGAGCGRTEGHRCSYRDMTGRRCGYWCDEHSVFMSGRTWCQRHANSVKWLHARDGSIYEIGPQAAIDDRSPNLVGTLVDDLNRPMVSGLMTIYGRQPGVQIVTDGHVRTASIPKGRVEHTPQGPIVLSEGGMAAWERGWGVFSHTGYLARVVLRVAATEPPMVYVYANGMLVMRRVPDWIANRGTGGDPAADRAKFRRDILAAVGPALPAAPEYDPDEAAVEA
jgi:hypothetical protein